MTLKSTRSLEEMRRVMLDPSASSGPDPVYQVFTDLNDHFWINKTVVVPGKLGHEFTKTMGHYHQIKVDETYFVANGKGVLVLQNDNEAFLIQAEMGDRVVISPEFGHSWSNVGSSDLVLFDNWAAEHSPTDYAWIEIEHGMSYFLTEENGAIKAVINPKYINPPSPIWLTAKEFSSYA